MMSRQPIVSFLLISAAILVFISDTSEAQQSGIYDEIYAENTEGLSAEQKKICEDFTESISVDPSDSVGNYLMGKAMSTLRCSIGLKDNNLEELRSKYTASSTKIENIRVPKTINDESLAYKTIPDYFTNRITDEACGNPQNISEAYSMNGRVGSLSRNKFGLKNTLSVKPSQNKTFEVIEELAGSILQKPARRHFVLSSDYIRIESHWDRSVDNKATTSFKTKSSEDGTRLVELSNKTGGRDYTGEGLVTTKVVDCLKQANGQYSQLIHVIQPHISDTLTRYLIKNPDSIYFPLSMRGYAYEIDIKSGKIVAFSETDYSGESLHIFTRN